MIIIVIIWISDREVSMGNWKFSFSSKSCQFEVSSIFEVAMLLVGRNNDLICSRIIHDCNSIMPNCTY